MLAVRNQGTFPSNHITTVTTDVGVTVFLRRVVRATVRFTCATIDAAHLPNAHYSATPSLPGPQPEDGDVVGAAFFASKPVV
ncbi:MAG: hypothetical protein K1Y36_30220 [Blastocatellia bacterium]|nr:hypothetical protein [Blastocatellia bacterium]